MKSCAMIEQLIQKYEMVLADLKGQSVESPEVFETRAKLAFLNSWKQVVEADVREGK